MNAFQQMIDAMKPIYSAAQLQRLTDGELADWYFEMIDTPCDGPSIDVVMAETEIARRGRTPNELLLMGKRAND
jgi:hypothetical protein